jgi:hypothetical protein
MANSLRYPGTDDNTPIESGDGLTPWRPRWKTLMWIIIVVAVVALFIILHVTGVVGAKTM